MQVKDMTTIADKLSIVDGINLSVRRNEVLTLVGHNGAGKSTFLNNIVGMVPMTSGNVELPDVDLKTDI